MKTLLLLEDEPSVMTFLRRMLNQYSVFEATSAEEALRFYADHHQGIDLLIAGLTLPTSSGIQIALVCRSKVSSVPVILISDYPVSGWSDRDSADLKRLGAESVTILQKPFQAQELRDAVRELIESPLSEKANTA